MGASGRLLFQLARDAASHARWAAKANGGTITVFDPQGKLFKTIEVAPNLYGEDGFVLPSCDVLGDGCRKQGFPDNLEAWSNHGPQSAQPPESPLPICCPKKLLFGVF